MAKRFKINIPNIPAVFNDQLGSEQRDWLKVQHPADYAYLVHLEKEADKEDAPEEKPAPADKAEVAGGKK